MANESSRSLRGLAKRTAPPAALRTSGVVSLPTPTSRIRSALQPAGAYSKTVSQLPAANSPLLRTLGVGLAAPLFAVNILIAGLAGCFFYGASRARITSSGLATRSSLADTSFVFMGD